MNIPENFTGAAETAMNFTEAQFSELTFDKAVLYFFSTYKAALCLRVTDNKTAKVRATLAEITDKLLSKIAVSDLPHEVKKPFEGKRVFIPSSDNFRVWKNAELLKDKCLSGLHIARITGGECVFFFGDEDEDYPYLSMLPDVRMPMIKNQTSVDFYKFAKKEITSNDILFTNGANGFEFAEDLRNALPGLITLNGLDMHRIWFMNICNLEIAPFWFDIAAKFSVSATSAKSVARQMNENPNFKAPVFHIPNGFYGEIPQKPASKKNVILTVGRLGTEQKNTAELLTGFAAAAEIFPEWSLRLVGSTQPDFMPFINQFYENYPALRERVIFTGPITDKTELAAEYSSAKIFALTSIFEGGNPNVYAEALVGGCFMLMRDSIDAAPEMVGNGKIGLKYGKDLPLYRALILSMSAMADKTFPYLFERHYTECSDYLKNELRYEIIAKKYMWLMYAKKLTLL
jgi:glycosyltransferase involved in cell wall biosynthesis